MKDKIMLWLDGHHETKRILHLIMIHPVKVRPRLWLRMLRFLYARRGRGSRIYGSVRLDIAPFNEFRLGKRSVIESFSVVNNLAGDIFIGDNSRVGIGNAIIGPVSIGDNVILAQNITVSALNHIYLDVTTPISSQGIETEQITICDNVWVGANSVITKGVIIGKNSVVAAGSVVTRDVPPMCVAAGSPAKIVKKFNEEHGSWERVLQ